MRRECTKSACIRIPVFFRLVVLLFFQYIDFFFVIVLSASLSSVFVWLIFLFKKEKCLESSIRIKWMVQNGIKLKCYYIIEAVSAFFFLSLQILFKMISLSLLLFVVVVIIIIALNSYVCSFGVQLK